MSRLIVTHPTTYRLEETIGAVHDFTLDLTGLNLTAIVKLEHTVNEINYDIWYTVEYSWDNTTFYKAYDGWADNQFYVTKLYDISNAPPSANEIFIRVRNTQTLGGNDGIVDVFDINVIVDDLVPDGITFNKPLLELPIGKPWGTYQFRNENLTFVFEHITSPVVDGGEPTDPPPATSTNLITGNVKKLGLPFRAKIVAVSLEVEPTVLGSTFSDVVTGDYVLDVYPHTTEVLLYAAPDYGKSFTPERLISVDGLVHPPTPNKYVYRALNDGKLALTEPVWVTSGTVVCGEVTLKVEPLYRPLMNGFLKPVVTPI